MENSNYSVRGLFTVSLPLILSAFGSGLMITCDRIMLAHYDMNVMNAVVSIGFILFLFEYSMVSIAITSEVFSGQYNGMNKKTSAPIATWQMLILSILSILIFIPSGLFLGKYIFPESVYEAGGGFFKIIMCFLFINVGTTSINGFFVGIKDTRIIFYNAFAANMINIFLSYNFIFGIEGYLEPMGVRGAAIATIIASIIQFTLIFSIFLSKKYHDIYRTRDFLFNKSIFFQCLKLGIPSSIGLGAEIIGNYLVQILVMVFAFKYISNHNIAMNVWIFLVVLLNGLHKGVSGLASNIIGQKKLENIDKLLKSTIILLSIFTLVISFVTVIFPEYTASFFTNDPEIIRLCKLTLPWIAPYFFFDGLGWVTIGILIAGGDTKTVMLISIISVWVFRVLPLYFILQMKNVDLIASGWMVGVFSSIIFASLSLLRYRSGKWLKLQVD